MPRPGQVKPETDERLSDRIAVGLLMRTFPPELVDRVVARCGREGQRNRLLPPRVVVYLVLAMCLFPGQGYEEVARLLTQGLNWAKHRPGSWQVPSTAAISRARVKLGPEPMRALFSEVAQPLAVSQTPGAFYRRWRLVAIDGTVFDVPDSEQNAAHFGRPNTHHTERCTYPQVRMVALTECGTHAITAAALGPLSSSEPALARGLFSYLGEGDLLLADRGFTGVELGQAASAGGADLLWRIRSHQTLPVREELTDGSYLSEVVAAKDRTSPLTVRVVEYTLQGPGLPEQDALYRLITTILDPRAAPAADLAALYQEQRGIETTLDELKTHQRGLAQVLRSRSPDGVEQEVWGHLLIHYAIRRLMYNTACAAQLDAELSFTRSIRLARRHITAQTAFPS
ncbi:MULTISPECIES: IS4 family transposase [unclassified Streptomyces]|uniref:IS4 family transposase n=1 Tax=unclassified Streptomyces TaxID=2593676 RepID=UPI002E2492AE|nr:IS4 family transposase [Streptomyces sp. NBC_01023]